MLFPWHTLAYYWPLKWMGILFINLLALAQSLSGAVMSHKNISSRELLSWPDDSVVALSLAADSKAGKDNRINTTLALWILLVPFVLGLSLCCCIQDRALYVHLSEALLFSRLQYPVTLCLLMEY